MGYVALPGVELFERLDSPTYYAIPTFIQPLDSLLNGGIRSGGITEVIGDSGLGKTTFCLQLCLNVQIPRSLEGLESYALFIDTENSFVVNRAREMAKHFSLHCNNVFFKKHGVMGRLSENKVLSGIYVVKCKDYLMLEKIMISLNEFISTNRKIRLIIIDSIAFPLYTQADGFWDRSKSLYSIGQVLHYLAEQYGTAVVVTNKLTTRFDSKGGEYYIPFLGEQWEHVPNQRILLDWDKGGRGRVAHVAKSCHELGKVNYKVTVAGIRE